MPNWEPGVIPLAANFQNNTTAPLDARSLVLNRLGLNDIDFPYPGLVVYVDTLKESYLCIDVDGIETSYNSGTDTVDETNWKKLHDDSIIDGGSF